MPNNGGYRSGKGYGGKSESGDQDSRNIIGNNGELSADDLALIAGTLIVVADVIDLMAIVKAREEKNSTNEAGSIVGNAFLSASRNKSSAAKRAIKKRRSSRR